MERMISSQGIKPDPAKVKAVGEMPEPTDKPGVKRLLGMVNFLSPFIPNMPTPTSPVRLRPLLKKDLSCSWTHEHTEAVKKVKDILSEDSVLKLYDREASHDPV